MKDGMATGHDKFDFTEAVARYARYLDPKHPEYSPDNSVGANFIDRYGAGYLVLSPILFPEFAARYFAGNFFDKAADERIELDFPQTYPDIKLYNKVYETFLSEHFSDRCYHKDFQTRRKGHAENRGKPMTIKRVRKKGVYPLTFSETEQALFTLQKNHDLLLSMAAIKQCITAYYIEQRDAVESAYGINFHYISANETESYKAVKTGFEAAIGNVRSSLTIPHDLTPQLAYHLGKQSPDDPCDLPFTREGFVKAFGGIFNRSAFQSVSDGGEYKECPFKKSLLDMTRCGLETQEDGAINSLPGQYTGRLIKDVRDIIRSRYLHAWSAPNDNMLRPYNY